MTQYGPYTKDPVVNHVIMLLVERSEKGMSTYGTTMADNPLSTEEWINHAIEEALDFACYLMRLKDNIHNENMARQQIKPPK